MRYDGVRLVARLGRSSGAAVVEQWPLCWGMRESCCVAVRCGPGYSHFQHHQFFRHSRCTLPCEKVKAGGRHVVRIIVFPFAPSPRRRPSVTGAFLGFPSVLEAWARRLMCVQMANSRHMLATGEPVALPALRPAWPVAHGSCSWLMAPISWTPAPPPPASTLPPSKPINASLKNETIPENLIPTSRGNAWRRRWR